MATVDQELVIQPDVERRHRWSLAAEGGHQLVAAPYDARQLGPLLPRLRKTLRETSFMGMPIMAGADLAAFLDLTRSLPAGIGTRADAGAH